jgi:hypothetical protein
MIINRSHIPWALLIIVATAVSAAIYLQLFRPGTVAHIPHIPVPDSFGARPYGHRSVGATPMGIVYGTIAYLIFIFATLLGARKKVRTWRIGRAEAWMRAHIWLSILTVPLVLFHCGFHSGSMMTTGLLMLYALVMVSGFYGLALQQFIPRQMMDTLSHEVIYEQIPYLRRQLVESALGLRKELGRRELEAVGVKQGPARAGAEAEALDDYLKEEARATVREMLEKSVLPYLRARNGNRSRLGRRQISDEIFRILKASVSGEYTPMVAEMQGWCDQRRQMDLQARMQHWLHYWLLVHVPASLLLLVWTGWHAVTGLYFY